MLLSTLCLLTPLSQAGEAPDLSGAQLYRTFCSSCHGRDARGDGPVAAYMTIKVPDLTRIATRNGGGFPVDRIHQIIDGRDLRPAHGSADMPVWGWEFFGTRGDDGARRQRTDTLITRLVEFLRSIQQP